MAAVAAAATKASRAARANGSGQMNMEVRTKHFLSVVDVIVRELSAMPPAVIGRGFSRQHNSAKNGFQQSPDRGCCLAGSGGGSGDGSNDGKSGPSGKSSASKWQPSQLAGGVAADAIGAGGFGGGGLAGFSPTPAAIESRSGMESSGSGRGFVFAAPRSAPSGTASGNASNAPMMPMPARRMPSGLGAPADSAAAGSWSVAALAPQRPQESAAIGAQVKSEAETAAV